MTLTVDEAGGFAELNGTKSWCSGVGLCTHALVTAHRPDGDRGLYAVDLRCSQVTALEDSWRNAGMKDTDTRAVEFSGATATPVGSPGEYLQRAGFWYGAIGVAACWLGAARGVAAALYRAVGNEHSNAAHDAHAQAHLGAIDAALTAADAVLIATACQDRRRNRLCQSGINRSAGTRRGRNRRGRNDRQNRTGIRPCAAGTGRRTRSPRRRFGHLCPAEPRRTRPRGAWAIGRAVKAAASTGNGARLVARPVAGVGTPEPTHRADRSHAVPARRRWDALDASAGE